MVNSATRGLSGVCLISTGVNSCIRSDLCKRLWPHQCGTERRQGTRVGVSGCCECRVWCDVDQSAGSERWREETSLRVRHFPSCCPLAKVNVVSTSRAQFQEVKKPIHAERNRRKKQGWSPQLKLKYHLGKQTGFPPVVTHPRHPCHLFLPVTSHPSASDHPHTAQYKSHS